MLNLFYRLQELNGRFSCIFQFSLSVSFVHLVKESNDYLKFPMSIFLLESYPYDVDSVEWKWTERKYRMAAHVNSHIFFPFKVII